MSREPPKICDFSCPFADFPPAETAGICRTMSAVWCKKLKATVNKNLPCEWRRQRETGKPKPGGRRHRPSPRSR